MSRACCDHNSSQDLSSERERNRALQAQVDQHSSGLQDATSRASTLSDDNQKLKGAVERLRQSIDEKAAEVQRLMQEASQLRQMNLTLETDAQLAKDAAAQSERKLNSAQEVRQSCSRAAGKLSQ